MSKVVTDINYKEVLAASPVVVVDFWATWCGPCRMLSPTVDAFALEYEGRALVAKCNVDDCPGIAMDLGIMSIPTLVFFKDGIPVDRTVGLVPKETIETKLKNLL